MRTYNYFWNRQQEAQILDYQTQQYKLFPAIATVIVYKLAAKWLYEKYSTVMSELYQGDLKHLSEVSMTMLFIFLTRL